MIYNVLLISEEKLKITAAAVQVGLGINQSKCTKDMTKQTVIAKKLFDRKANNPSKNQLKRVTPSKIIENQLTLGINSYKLETINPKLILGVADPLIINSGVPV